MTILPRQFGQDTKGIKRQTDMDNMQPLTRKNDGIMSCIMRHSRNFAGGDVNGL